MPTPTDHDELVARIERDLIDSYDEELELEIEDRHPTGALGEATTETPAAHKARRMAQFDYHEIERLAVVLPARVHNPDYFRQPVPDEIVVSELYDLRGA